MAEVEGDEGTGPWGGDRIVRQTSVEDRHIGRETGQEGDMKLPTADQDGGATLPGIGQKGGATLQGMDQACAEGIGQELEDDATPGTQVEQEV